MADSGSGGNADCAGIEVMKCGFGREDACLDVRGQTTQSTLSRKYTAPGKPHDDAMASTPDSPCISLDISNNHLQSYRGPADIQETNQCIVAARHITPRRAALHVIPRG